MLNISEMKIIDILLIEDNPADIRLTQEVMKESKIHNQVKVVMDGVEAMDFLKREGKYVNETRPDIILLDLNLPKKDGRDVLKEIKLDENLKMIPVVILTTSKADQDVVNTYNLHANCYITKPVDLDQFITVIKSIEDFWFTIVKLPENLDK